jgi:hypothetical protein
MHPKNLPKEIKDLVIAKIQKHPHISVNRAIDAIQQDGDFADFVSMDKKLSDIRNESWADLNPELYDQLKDFI